jgi:hypothetical protein
VCSLFPNGEVVRKRAHNLVEAFSSAAEEYERIAVLTVQGFGQLLVTFAKRLTKFLVR